jgi:tetratricopeptide (TPR) repeat protein
MSKQAEFERSLEFRRALNESAALLRQQRAAEAVEMLLTLAQAAPNHPDVAINLAGAYILQRKWGRAVRLLERALEMHPDNVMLWINLGAAQLGNLKTAGPRQQQKAIAAYERALQVDPAAPNVHYHLGLIYMEGGDFERARLSFRSALQVNPADRDASYWLGRLDELAAKTSAG